MTEGLSVLVAHSARFLSSLKTTLFDRGCAGSAPE